MLRLMLTALGAPLVVLATLSSRPAVAQTQLDSVSSDFNTSQWLIRGDRTIPSAKPDFLGAFRFLCAPSHNGYDDPIVHPGQPGTSHLHTFFGNTETDANSTYESLRTRGDSTCAGGPLNRSAYWIPAMMDGKGQVVMPDEIWVYYKATPGITATLPRGLRMVFGANPANPNASSPHYWYCENASPHQKTIGAAGCPQGVRLGGVTATPQCWNGRDLDSPDHRSHLAYKYYNSQGQFVCPEGYNVEIPQFSIAAWYSHNGPQDLSQWYLTSDRHGNHNLPGGSSFHSDWFGAWDDEIMKVWMDNCISKKLSCVAGELGDGRQLTYPKIVKDQRVPVPARDAASGPHSPDHGTAPSNPSDTEGPHGGAPSGDSGDGEMPENGGSPPSGGASGEDSASGVGDTSPGGREGTPQVAIVAEPRDIVARDHRGDIEITRPPGANGGGIVIEPAAGGTEPARIAVANAGEIRSPSIGIAVATAVGAAEAMNSGSINAEQIGIQAATLDGSATVANTAQGSITTSGTGIMAFTTSGVVDVRNSGAIRSVAGEGILIAAGEGKGTVNNAGAIMSQASAALRAQATTGTVEVVNSGALLSTNGIGLETSTGSDGRVLVSNSGQIAAGDFERAGGARAIHNAGGNLVFDNEAAGVVTGSFSSEPGTTSRFNNAGVFNFGGRATLFGSENFRNSGLFNVVTPGALEGLEQFENSGAVDMRGGDLGGMATFVNSGTLAASGTRRLGGLEDQAVNSAGIFAAASPASADAAPSLAATTFDNSGGLITMMDGSPTDSLSLAGDYHASGDARLGVDAFLSGPASSADVLTIAGSASGTTSVVVNDINPLPGAYNPDGVVIVDVSGDIDGDFVLSRNSAGFNQHRNGIDKGFFLYQIAQHESTFRLVSRPDADALEVAALGTGAQAVFFETAEGWLDHQNGIRNRLLAGEPFPIRSSETAPAEAEPTDYPVGEPVAGFDFDARSSPQGHPAVWGSTIGNWSTREADATVRVPGADYNVATGYGQNVYGFQGGIDFGTDDLISSSDVAILGVMAGFVSSNIDFEHSPNSAEYEGGTVGISATYLLGSLFQEVQVKADFLELDASLPGIGSDRADVTTWGITSNVGYRLDWDRYSFTPMVTLAYAHTSIDGFDFDNGIKVGYGDVTSLRGALGGEFGGLLLDRGAFVLRGLVLARLWREFSGESEAFVDAGGTTLATEDDLEGTFTELEAGLNLAGKESGWSGFVTAVVKLSEDITSFGSRVGLRYRW